MTSLNNKQLFKLCHTLKTGILLLNSLMAGIDTTAEVHVKPQLLTFFCVSLYCSSQGVCQPVCDQGCVHGNCVAPNRCECHFGHVGDNCSLECLCNGHSNCMGVTMEMRQICVECHNNTRVSCHGNRIKKKQGRKGFRSTSASRKAIRDTTSIPKRSPIPVLM